jgi:hypothetical protein
LYSGIDSLKDLFLLKSGLLEKRMDFAIDRVKVVTSISCNQNKQFQRMVLETQMVESELNQLRQDRKMLLRQLVDQPRNIHQIKNNQLVEPFQESKDIHVPKVQSPIVQLNAQEQQSATETEKKGIYSFHYRNGSFTKVTNAG